MRRVVTPENSTVVVEFTLEERMLVIKAFRNTFILDTDPRFDVVAEFVGLLRASK